MNTVRGCTRLFKTSFTRPADTNAYTSGDVVANSTSAAALITINPVTRGDGEGSILQEVLFTTSANVATKPDLELWLFDTAPVVVNDNAAFAPTDAEMLTLVGIVVIPASGFKVGLSTAGTGNAACLVANLGMPVHPVAGNTLYGVLVARSAYVPISGEVFGIRLKLLD